MELEFPHNLKSSDLNYNKSAAPTKPITFLNYVPTNNQLKHMEISSSNKTKEIEEAFFNTMKQQIFKFLEEKQSLNILPKKSSVDLKRFISKKMEKLNKRTELAIVELLRNKIQEMNMKEQNIIEIKTNPDNKPIENIPSSSLEKNLTKEQKDINTEIDKLENDDYDGDANIEDGKHLVERLHIHEKMMQNDSVSSENESDDDQKQQKQ